MVTTPADIIKDKTVPVLAARLNKREKTVEMWRFRNRLPRSVWPEIMREFPDLDYDALTRAEKNQGRKAA